MGSGYQEDRVMDSVANAQGWRAIPRCELCATVVHLNGSRKRRCQELSQPGIGMFR